MAIRFASDPPPGVVCVLRDDAPPMPCIRSFHREQVYSKDFNPLVGVEGCIDFTAHFQFEQLRQGRPEECAEGTRTEWTPMLEDVLVVHNQALGRRRYFLDRQGKDATIAEADYRFRAAVLMARCWAESPGDPEATEFLLLYLSRQGPQGRSMRRLGMYGTDMGLCYPAPWKVHSPLVNFAPTASWFDENAARSL